MQASPSGAAEPRMRKRIPCAITIDGDRKKAMVLNLSRHGLFVQTTVRAARGTELRVSLDLEDHSQPVELPARIVWTRRSTSRMAELNAGGFGLRLCSTPQSYVDYLDEHLPVIKPPPAAAEPLRRFRVRLALRGTSRTRLVDVEARDEVAAGDLALRRVRTGADASADAAWVALSILPRDAAGPPRSGDGPGCA